MNYISGFQLLLLERFQMATGTGAGMWERKQSDEQWDCSAGHECSTPTCAPPGKLSGRPRAQLSPLAFPPALPLSPFISGCLQSLLQSQGTPAAGRDKGQEERLGVGSAAAPCPTNCPLPLAPAPAQVPRVHPRGRLTKPSWVKK